MRRSKPLPQGQCWGAVWAMSGVAMQASIAKAVVAVRSGWVCFMVASVRIRWVEWSARCVAGLCLAAVPVCRRVALCVGVYQPTRKQLGLQVGSLHSRAMNMPLPAQHALPLVLVVDDDPDLRELLATYLGANGYRVCTVADGVALRDALSRGTQPDVIVMDLMLPGEDGLSLTRHVKAHGAVPVLMLSAKGEEMDRVIGLEVGADDYLPKPFGPRELLARLRALLRRSVATAPAGSPTEALKTFGPFTLDVPGHRLMRSGTEVPLTTAEFELLATFASRPHRVLSRDVLVELLKGFDRDAFDRSMDNRVTRLRRKIEADPAHPVYIRTVRGEGYLFNPHGAER